MEAILTDIREDVAFFIYTLVFPSENGPFFIRKGPYSRDDGHLGS